MAIQTIPELFQALRAGCLLTNGQVDTLTRELLPRFADVRSLARELVRRDWVTPYQINQLFLGREQDLSLGPFLLLERLGEGGMGQVFKARHRKLNRVVALKVMRKDKLGNSEAVRRFYREVQAAAVLSHPNIVTAFDAGEIDGTHFLAMEYIDGSDLGKLVRKNGPQAVPVAIDYIRQAALGLQHAFEKGLVHRDIKPSNLIVQLSGTQSEAGPLVKILDMGLALVAIAEGAEASATLTQTHSVLGTPDFIAPEQARSAHDADTRSDLYSLGCTLYFVLTGEVPFAAATAMEKLLKHYLEEPPRLESLRPDVPPAVAAVVRKLMSKSPEQRYQTPAELAAVLGSVLNVRAALPVAVPVAVPVGPDAPDAREDAVPAVAPPAAETVPEVGLEFETADSIIRSVKTKRTPRPGPKLDNLWSYVIGGVAIGLLVTMLIVLFRYLR